MLCLIKDVCIQTGVERLILLDIFMKLSFRINYINYDEIKSRAAVALAENVGKLMAGSQLSSLHHGPL